MCVRGSTGICRCGVDSILLQALRNRPFFFFSLQSPLSLSPFLPLTVGGGGIAAFAFRTFLFVWFGEDEFWGKVGNLFSVSFRSNKSQILPSQQTSTYLGLGQATLL